jgi:hypothetical protein
MIADHIPDVAQARRLGHTLPDKIEDIYSHVAPEVDARLLASLQQRWESAAASIAARPWLPTADGVAPARHLLGVVESTVRPTQPRAITG